MGDLQAPRGWSAATFCFWGAATGHWLAAAVGAVLVELANGVAWRWDLSAKHFERLADLTSLGFVALSIYQFSEFGLFGIYAILGAFPLCLLPLLIAQRYSTTDRIPLSAFVMSSRRAHTARSPVDLAPTCGCTCLLAAATGTLPAPWFSLGAILGFAVLVAANRPRRYRASYFGLLLALVVMLAWGGYRGLVWSQYRTSDLLQALFTQVGWVPADTDSTYTAIGTLGRLKLSDRIALRIAAPRNIPLPLRLTEARYQLYQHGMWRNPSRRLITIDPAATKQQWAVGPAGGAQRQLTITAERSRELGALALPAGAASISGDDLIELQRHPLGAIVAESRPGFLRYTVDYRDQSMLTTPPLPEDLEVPKAYREALTALSAEIGAHGLPARDVRRRLEEFFARNFRYSLVQRGFFAGRMPLLTFLRNTRHGHCEYFASATTLLLRVFGVPARYVVGYMVDEYSPLERSYVARARHAHAWSEAYIDGVWQVVDTTPSLWLDEEAERASNWHMVGDLWSWSRWQVQQIRRGEFNVSPWLAASLPVLIAWLMWRLRGLSRRQERRLTTATMPPHVDLKRLFDHIAQGGARPAPGDTALKFLLAHWRPAQHGTIKRVCALYYAWRFRPGGITPAEQKVLREGVSTLLREPRDLGTR